MVWRESPSSSSVFTTMDSMTLRSLYHLDFFRRNLRGVSEHMCTNSNGSLLNCLVCIIKDLFNELCKMMSGNPLDPLAVQHLVESRVISLRGLLGTSSNLSSPTSPESTQKSPNSSKGQAFYETFLEALHRATLNTPTAHCHDPGCQLHFISTEFSLTKVCLDCRTTCVVERICQYVHNIETPSENFLYYPSFEFGLKIALDSNEFCVKPNCFGNLKIFRTLLQAPSLLTFRFSSEFEFCKLPSSINVSLIFELHSNCELYINSIVLQAKNDQAGSTSAILFFHTRLKLWIFIDRDRIQPLQCTWDEVKFDPNQLVQNYRPSIVIYANIPPEQPQKQQQQQVQSQVANDHQVNNWDNHVYVNWPLNINTNLPVVHQNQNPHLIGAFQDRRLSTTSNSNSSSNSNSTSPEGLPRHFLHHQKNHLLQGITSVQIHDQISSDSGLSEEIKSNNSSNTSNCEIFSLPMMNPFNHYGPFVGDSLNGSSINGGGSIVNGGFSCASPTNPNVNEVNNKKFATIRKGTACSTSSTTANGGNLSNCARIKSHHSFNSSKSRMLLTNSISVPDLSGLGVKPPALLPPQNHHHQNNHGSLISTSYEAPASLVNNRKVSFNYKVTLLDDSREQEEYIPHPIFQSVVNKMLQMQAKN